jgi:hypothetical protein
MLITRFMLGEADISCLETHEISTYIKIENEGLLAI